MDPTPNAVQRRRGKKKNNAGPSREAAPSRDRERGSNWAQEESDILLDIASEVQLKYKRSNLNFTSPQEAEIYAMFCHKFPGTTRTQGQLVTRISTMKKEFTILKRLSLKSGWSWNYEDNVVVSPSPEICQAALQRLEKRWAYLEKKTFPWFDQLDKLMGGAQNRGIERDLQFPIDTSTHGSVVGSHTDSSDDPPEDEYAGIDQSVHQQQDSNNPAAQGSDSSFPISGSSGSKRKSTDSDVPLTQGKKIQRNIKEKRKEIKEMNETNKELLQTVKDLVKGKSSKTTEMDSCIEKMNALNLRGDIRFWLIKQCGKQWFRRYFLSASMDEISEHYRSSCNVQPQPNMQPPEPNIRPTQPYMYPPQSYMQPPQGNMQPPPQTSFDPTFYENFNMFGLHLRPPSE